jgi:hypothetical protein
MNSVLNTWAVRSVASARLVLHPRDLETRLTSDDLDRARQLNVALAAAPPTGPPGVAARILLDALVTRTWTSRYLFLWIALEALFAAEAGGEAMFRLAYRMALFLRRGDEARDLFRRATKAYGIRSAIAHGHRKRDLPDSDAVMAEVEDWIREALSKILLDQRLLERFSGNERDEFLTELTFRGAPELEG